MPTLIKLESPANPILPHPEAPAQRASKDALAAVLRPSRLGATRQAPQDEERNGLSDDARTAFQNGVFVEVADRFRLVEAEALIPDGGGVILPLARFETDGARLLDEGRPVGVLLQPEDQVEALAYDLPRIAVVALSFPKFRDGRAYSSAALLRTRLGYTGEVRAVGDVLREQAREMVRCGFDTFAPSDGSSPAEWAAAAGRYRHVYQTAADHRAPAFVERSNEGHE